MLSPAPFDLFFNRRDPKDPRLGETCVRLTENTLENQNLKSFDACIIGYPDDRGIFLNRGRVGASKAPDTVRKYFYRLTQGIHGELKSLKLLDIGNLETSSPPQECHDKAASMITHMCRQGVVPLIIGGGNDYAYADAAGVLGYLPNKKKLGIINIDAHLDVRDLSYGVTSGTPYYRILETFHSRIPKGCFIEFGIQIHKNSREHLKYVQKKGGKVFTLDEILKIGAEKVFKKILRELEKKCDAIICSLDMDAVKQSDAPGVSAPSPRGLSASDIEAISFEIGRSKKTRLFSIYEVSPTLDRDDQTSRLASIAMWMFLAGRSS